MNDTAKTKLEIGFEALSKYPRAFRRKFFRNFLKANKVPKPIFPKFSMNRNFKRLNFLSFLEEIAKVEMTKDEYKVELKDASDGKAADTSVLPDTLDLK